MTRRLRRISHLLALFTMTLLVCALSYGQSQIDHKKKSFVFPSTVPVPAYNKLTPSRVKLGEMLFFDPRLSAPIGSVARPATTQPWDGRTANLQRSGMA